MLSRMHWAETDNGIETRVEDRFVLGGTGSRSFNPVASVGVLEQLRELMGVQAEEHDNLTVMSGMAEGWDEWIARVAIELRLPFIVVIPNPDYGDYYWRQHSLSGENRLREFQRLLDLAVAIEYVRVSPRGKDGIYGHANFDRNQRMVDLGDFFAVFRPQTQGTIDCLRRLRRTHTPHSILA